MDNRDIMRDLGYTDEQIQDYYDRGIVGEFDLETTIKRYRLREVIPHMRPDWKGLPKTRNKNLFGPGPDGRARPPEGLI